MATIPQRWNQNQAWFFVTVVTKNRFPWFNTQHRNQHFLDACREARTYYHFRIAAMVLLPDHWHALLRPDSVSLGKVVGAIKRNTWRRLANGQVSIWHPKFLDHRIRNGEDFAFHMEYIRSNPTKHGYGDSYPWCFLQDDPFSS